jgi:hypothetical protein
MTIPGSFMKRFAWAAAIAGLVLGATPTYADVFKLADGTVVEGALIGSTDDAILVKLTDGTTRRIAKVDLKAKEARPVTPAAPAPAAPPTPVVARAVELTTEERLLALKKAARDGLSLRARLVVGARELATWVALKVEGGYALSTQAKKFELDQATFIDKNVDEVAHELWDKRARPADERFRALKAVTAAVCWVEADVLSAGPSGSDTEAVIEWKSLVLRGKTRIRTTDAESVKPRTLIRLPVALLVRQEEGAQFLAGQMGDSVSLWPLDFVPIAAEIGSGSRGPRTVAADLALRVGERTVTDAVKTWYVLRTRIRCGACKTTRKCFCPECHGRGGYVADFISATGEGGGAVWRPCSRCKGQGFHTCQLCKDGLDEYVLKDALRRFGTYGKPLGGFLLEGQRVEMNADGKGASVTTWIRDRANDQPRAETLRWVVDEKTGTWKPAS